MGRTLNIAICGAGIGGLSAALLLSRAGHDVTLLDQFDAPGPVGSGLMLQPTGLAVLSRLGLADDLKSLGTPIERLWGLTATSGKPVLDVRFENLRADVKAYGVQRPALFSSLFKAVEESGVPVLTSKRVESVDTASGDITLETGEFLTGFDLVVDALGANSPLSPKKVKPLAYGALWATVEQPTASRFDASALEQRYRGAHQMAGVMGSGRTTPGGRATLTYFWSLKLDDHAGWSNAPLDAWKEDAVALWPETLPLLEGFDSHDQLTFARYRHRTLCTPVRGQKLVHIGDAWHATSPQLGQGANMALLDAWALSMALEEKTDIAAALPRFRALRSLHVRLYQTMSWAFTPFYQGDSRFMAGVRDHVAAPLSRIRPAPRLLAGMVTGAFGSPLKRLRLHT